LGTDSTHWRTGRRGKNDPFQPTEDDYLVYTYNRFQACRFGLEGTYVDPATSEQFGLREHILLTMQRLQNHAPEGSKAALQELRKTVNDGMNDARRLRDAYASAQQLPEVVRQSALRFRGD
jgi:glutamate---cysteine ligase / carboxylate-amine ligase